MDYIGLGRRIRKLRQQQHWTQEELADHVGISISFLGHIERGSRKASMETLVSIANAFSVSVDYLLADSLALSGTPVIPQSLDERQRHVLKEVVRLLADNPDAWGGEHSNATSVCTAE